MALENWVSTSSAKKRILVFGGSTVWGTGSADEFTIPSYLQQLVNVQSDDYIVHNYGFASVTTKQQVDRLMTLEVLDGDIVVFYAGGNDQWQSVINGDPAGTIIGYNDRNKLRIVINKLKAFLNVNSRTYRLLDTSKIEISSNQIHVKRFPSKRLEDVLKLV